MPNDNALVLQVGADISSLERQMQRAPQVVDQAANAAERRAQTMATRVGASLGSALGSSVASAGASQIGALGSGLVALGAAGVIGAAGIAAVAQALSQARAAAAFADSISDTANRLHVTTDALQEYRYAVRAAGGEEEGADRALEAFSRHLGDAQGGLRGATQLFRSLGFTSAQVRGFHDTDEALRAVTQRINELSTTAQRDSAIQRFGLEGMSQLILQGVDGMSRLRAEAERLGVVMDSELVRRGGELNQQFETLNRVIEVQLHSAFVDLGPVLTGLLSILAGMARFVADMVDGLRSIENRTNAGLRRELQQTSEEIGQLQARIAQEGPSGSLVNMLASRVGTFAQIQAEILSRESEAGPTAPTGDRNLIPPAGRIRAPRQRHGPQDPSDRMGAQLDSAIATAQREFLQAQIEATDDIQARASLGREVLQQEQASANAQIAAHQAQLDHARGLSAAERAILQGKITELRAVQAQVNNQRMINADAAEQVAIDHALLENARLLGDLEIQERDARASIARTLEERQNAEITSFQQRQNLDAAEYEEELQQKVLRHEITQLTADERLAQFRRTQAAQLAAERDHLFRQANPLFDYGHQLDSLNADMQSVAVHGLQSLNEGLVNAIMNTKSLGQVFHEISSQILADLLRIAIQRAITIPLANAIFGNRGPSNIIGEVIAGAVGHNAGGTDDWPGGLTWVGEKGRELVNLPGGSKVISNRNIEEASKLGGRSATVIQPIFNNFNGAVVTEDLMRQANNNARRVAQQAGIQAYSQAMRDAPHAVAQRQREGR